MSNEEHYVVVWQCGGGGGGPVQGIMGMGNLRAGETLGIHISHASHESQPPCRGPQGRIRAKLSTEAAVRGGVKLLQTAND